MTTGMLRQHYDTSAVVSARAHGFYTVPYSYQFFQQGDVLRIVSTRQNKECLTERIDNVECTGTFKLMLFLGATHLQTLPTQSDRVTLGKTLAGVIQMTVSTNCAGSR